MNDYIVDITLDINCVKSAPKIFSAQYDKGRIIRATITSDGKAYSVNGCSAVLKGINSDKSYFAIECTVNDEGNITARLEDTTLSVRGLTVAKFVLTDGHRTYSTQKFIIDVDSDLDGNITADSNYPILNRLIEQIHALNESGAILVDSELNADSNNAVSNAAVVNGFLNTFKYLESDDIDGCTDYQTIYDVTIDGKYYKLFYIEGNNSNTQIAVCEDGTVLTRTSSSEGTSTIWGNWQKLAFNSRLDEKANKTEVEAALDAKANKATTLVGYGITDGVTSEKLNTELAKKQNTLTYDDTPTGGHTTQVMSSNAILVALGPKYDKSNVEKGTGTLTITSSADGRVAEASFDYQKVGAYVNVSIAIKFLECSIKSANTGILLTGLPFICKCSENLRELCVTTEKKQMLYAIAKGSSSLTLLVFNPEEFVANEKLSFNLTYKIV